MLFISVLGAYLALGLLFGIYFLFSGYHQLLPDAAGARLRVRLIWIVAAIVIWPLLLVKLFNARDSA